MTIAPLYGKLGLVPPNLEVHGAFKFIGEQNLAISENTDIGRLTLITADNTGSTISVLKEWKPR